MSNKNILDIGSLLADWNQVAAPRFGRFIQDVQPKQDDVESVLSHPAESEDRGSIGDYGSAYREISQLLSNVKEKWAEDSHEQNLQNKYYQRDLLYLYDRITLDMEYLSEYPERNASWLETLLELKYEIRNLL